MTPTRTVKLFLSEKFFEIAGDNREFHKAVAYLTRWALGSARYKDVDIHGCDEGHDAGSLVARYTSPAGTLTMLIAAVLDHGTGTYSFHS